MMLAEPAQAGQARDYLFEIGREAVPGVHQALKTSVESRHRADLVQMIGYLGGAEDLSMIQPLLADVDERVQRAAGAAVVRLKRSQ